MEQVDSILLDRISTLEEENQRLRKAQSKTYLRSPKLPPPGVLATRILATIGILFVTVIAACLSISAVNCTLAKVSAPPQRGDKAGCLEWCSSRSDRVTF